MNIVIVGAGKVGSTLVQNFLSEKHNIYVVDSESAVVNDVVNHYDVKGIVGSGLDRKVLLDAETDKADFLIACTSRDEMNILCCVLGRKLGVRCTIARVRDPEYVKEMETMREDLGVDFFFNPEYRTAEDVVQVLKFPSASTVESFANGRAIMVEFNIDDGNPIIDKSLKEISQEYGNKILIAMVRRGEKVYIPKGDFVIKNGDDVHIIADEAELTLFSKKLKIFKPRAKSVFVVGGGKVAYYLSKALIDSGVDVKIIENDQERAEEISQLLPKATVILGDGTEQETLDEENLKNNDACVTLTGIDEENVIISLYAKQRGVEKVITKVDRKSVADMAKMLGLDTLVSPRISIANHIIRFVRAHQAETGSGINTLYKFSDKVEGLEFTVDESFKGIGVMLKDLKLIKQVLIGGIVRNNQFILPSGFSKLEKGDRVIVITAAEQIRELGQILD